MTYAGGGVSFTGRLGERQLALNLSVPREEGETLWEPSPQPWTLAALSLGDAAGERARCSSLSLPLECAELLLLGNGTYLGPTRDSVREWPEFAGWPGVAGNGWASLVVAAPLPVTCGRPHPLATHANPGHSHLEFIVDPR